MKAEQPTREEIDVLYRRAERAWLDRLLKIGESERGDAAGGETAAKVP